MRCTSYDDKHRIIRLIGDGHTSTIDRTIATNEYDSEDRVVKQKAYGQNNQTWVYLYAPGLTQEVNPLQGTISHRFDKDGLNTSVVDALGNETLKFYDAQKRTTCVMLPVTDANGTLYRPATYYSYDLGQNLSEKFHSPHGTTEKWKYSSTNLLEKYTDQNGHATNYSNYSSTFQPQTVVDATGVTTKTTYAEGTGVDATGAGQIKTVTIVEGGVDKLVATYFYEPAGYGNATRALYPAHAGASTGGEVQHAYSDLGDLSATTNELGVMTTFHRNLRRQQTGSTIQHSDLGSLQSSSTIDATGNATSQTNFRQFTTTSTFSSQGKHLTTTHPAPGSPTLTNVYDDRDWVTEVHSPFGGLAVFGLDKAGRKISSTNALNQRTEFGFDELGRIELAKNALLQSAETKYLIYTNADLPAGMPPVLPGSGVGGDLVKSVDPLLRTSYQFMDAAGNVRLLVTPTGQETSLPSAAWQFEYDDANRPLKTIRPSGATDEKVYDDAGRLKKSILQSGIFTEATYDQRGFVDTTAVKRPNGASGVTVLRYTHRHDAAGNQKSVREDMYNITGTSVVQSQEVQQTYDNQNRVRTFTGADGRTIGYRYNANGSLSKILYPDNTDNDWTDNDAVSYTYDSMDRLETVTDWSNRTTTYTWAQDGTLSKITRPNNSTRSLRYDETRRLISIMERDSVGKALLHLRLGYDAAGRLARRMQAPQLPRGVAVQEWGLTHDRSNRANELYYDDHGNLETAYRLKGMAPSGSSYLFPFGLVSNPLSIPLLAQDEGLHVWSVTNKLLEVRHYIPELGSSAAPLSCHYDAAGNLVKLATGRVWGNSPPEWSTENTLLTVSPVSPTGPSQVIVRDCPVRYAAPDSQRYVNRYVYGLGLLYEVDGLDDPHYYHGDQVGSTVMMTDKGGKVEARFEYSPYGVITRSKVESMNSLAPLHTPFLFCGESGCMTDTGTGLVYMRARWYNPWLGRFISEDPIQFEGGNNWYSYANGDPLTNIDPRGLNPDAIFTGEQDFYKLTSFPNIIDQTWLGYETGRKVHQEAYFESQHPNMLAYAKAFYSAMVNLTLPEKHPSTNSMANLFAPQTLPRISVIPGALAPKDPVVQTGKRGGKYLLFGEGAYGDPVQGDWAQAMDLGSHSYDLKESSLQFLMRTRTLFGTLDSWAGSIYAADNTGGHVKGMGWLFRPQQGEFTRGNWSISGTVYRSVVK